MQAGWAARARITKLLVHACAVSQAKTWRESRDNSENRENNDASSTDYDDDDGSNHD